MRLHTVCLIVWTAAMAVGCGTGGGTDGTGGTGGTGQRFVTLSVTGSLPSELTDNCGSGDPSELDALLQLATSVDTFSCTLAADASGAVGDCEDIPTDNNYDVTLTYRVMRAGPFALAQQIKLVELPADASSPVAVTFSGVAIEPFFDQNRTDWCAGLL